MKPFVFLLSFLIAAGPVLLSAQIGAPGLGGARGLAMGGAALGLREVEAALSNPAGLAFLEHFSATAVAENRFLSQEISQLSAAAALPAAGGVFGASVLHYGFDLYNEQRFGLAYARRLSEGLTLGAQFFFLQTTIPDYGNRAWLSFELGLQADLLPGLALNARVYNPMRQEVVEGERLPTVFSAGLSYRPSTPLLIALEAEKDIDYPVRARAGLEYQLASPLALRVGLATAPVSLSFGLGFTLPIGLGLDVSSNYHQYLGFSPAFGISWRGRKNG